MKRYVTKLKRIVAILLCVALIVPIMPDVRALAQDMDTKYPYTMFASSEGEGAITINVGNSCINGDIATNGTVVTNGNMNLNGQKSENAGSDIIQVLKKLDELYFYTDNVRKINKNYVSSDINVNINQSIDATGSINITGNANINAKIKAYKDIEISGGTLNANNTVIFSEVGNVNIKSDNVSVTGIIYAPKGNVTITGQNINLNSVVVIAETITITGSGLNANYGSSYAKTIGSESLEYTLDNLPDVDEDGLPDTTEKKIGTDVFSSDTDKDGLSDYEEIFDTHTDYLKYDSVEEGVADGISDKDGDGLTNIQEIELGTYAICADSDEDGLTDSEEVEKYHTLPLNYDSDNDGLSDGDEIALGTNPLSADTDNDGVFDGAETFRQTVNKSRIDSTLFDDNYAIPQAITVSAKGNVNSTLEVIEYTGHLKGDGRNYVGKVIEVKGNEIVDGKITFELSDTYKLKNYVLAGENTNGLIICCNKDENTIPLSTVYDEKSRTLSADMTSEGIYFVLNVIEFVQSLGIDPFDGDVVKCVEESDASTYSLHTMTVDDITPVTTSSASIGNVQVKGQADIVFVIDTTGSMSEEIANVKNNISAFAEEIMNANIMANFALIDYKDIEADGSSSTRVIKNGNSNWYNNASDFKSALNRLSVAGGGDGPESVIDALALANELDMRSSAQKFFVLVTDCNYKIKNNHGVSSVSEMLNKLNDSQVSVSVVTSSSYANDYKDFYAGTGGVCANIYGNFKSELLKIADAIKADTNDGYWIATNGLTPNYIKLNEMLSLDGTMDTDGDGIPDIEELQRLEHIKELVLDGFFEALNIGKKIVTSIADFFVVDYKSNPALVDTDGDGITDEEEYIINTNVKLADSDDDKLTDGQEIALWFDPMNADADYDRRKDNV